MLRNVIGHASAGLVMLAHKHTCMRTHIASASNISALLVTRVSERAAYDFMHVPSLHLSIPFLFARQLAVYDDEEVFQIDATATAHLAAHMRLHHDYAC